MANALNVHLRASSVLDQLVIAQTARMGSFLIPRTIRAAIVLVPLAWEPQTINVRLAPMESTWTMVFATLARVHARRARIPPRIAQPARIIFP